MIYDVAYQSQARTLARPRPSLQRVTQRLRNLGKEVGNYLGISVQLGFKLKTIEHYLGCSMTSSHLTLALDTWTSRAVVASRYLLGLYRGLGDEKQASKASQAGILVEERARRLGLADHISALQSVFADEHTEELLGEAQAWQTLVEALAGICAFHAMVDSRSEKSRGLLGARNAATKAFHRSIQGYRVAFPEEMAIEGISKAIQAATERCTETFLAGLPTEESPEDRSALEIHKMVQEALLSEAGV